MFIHFVFNFSSKDKDFPLFSLVAEINFLGWFSDSFIHFECRVGWWKGSQCDAAGIVVRHQTTPALSAQQNSKVASKRKCFGSPRNALGIYFSPISLLNKYTIRNSTIIISHRSLTQCSDSKNAFPDGKYRSKWRRMGGRLVARFSLRRCEKSSHKFLISFHNILNISVCIRGDFCD